MGLASMEEVALCLRFMDLLRQDFPAVGEGMAEASCCPLRLVGTIPPIPLPFIPLGTGMPLTDSEKKEKEDGRLGFSFQMDDISVDACLTSTGKNLFL